MPTARNLLNLKSVEKGYGSRSVLRDLTLGVAAGERIGIVGENGGGKSTLLRLVAGVEQPDAGALTRSGDVDVALLGQRDDLDEHHSIRDALVGARADHEWAGDSAFRDVLDGLLGGVELRMFASGIDTPLAGLSGGERRRVALARLLLEPPELLLLDEPTNHLDLEGVDWLARHLAARRGSMLVVTHDRWFLDAVCTSTWEVADGAVHQYEGGYAAYVLARAERDRQESAREDRRRQLVRKELAWLRRGPPARTTKPKFRIDAANALIADEPPARDRAELLRFAGARLGDKVLDAEHVSLTLGQRRLLNDVTWRLGPGERVAIVGVNGSGKTSLVRLLAGELQPTAGEVQRGATVRLAHLSQDTVEIPEELRVLESLQELRSHAVLSDGQEITAALLCERFGFRGEKARTNVCDLSGGERRRLALMRLMMGGPNVLLLDEPTNDLDIDTLTALEDLLDGWPGTLVVVSHDRYFVERVCDDVYALTDAGGLRHLPGGIEQYIEERQGDGQPSRATPTPGGAATSASPESSELPAGARIRADRKQTQRSQRELARLERAIEQSTEREAALAEQMAAAASDHAELVRLQGELEQLLAERERLEGSWLETSEALEG
ncbi:MAG TPA: ABC-F family ATP-binding cassette domain-containing protein [Solirubrobacteraceae bacterium]|jgi:ATP-binding cassette subfamily F protein uup|nr:ABC-F family ATP-binding cassette domain-containing protein [Solirubrobacteraceae bacterium]